MLRKTKIIATLGPATESDETIRRLIEAGTGIFRMNMSHASHGWARERAAQVRRQCEGLKCDVALLMDLQGPAIRTGPRDEPMRLAVGERIELTMGSAPAELPLSVTVNYDGLADDVSVGDTMLVDNGVLHLRVLGKDRRRILCEVLTEGDMGSRRRINLPGVRINLPALTEKDFEDLDLAVELGVDFIAMSFVRDAKHVDKVRELLSGKGCAAKIVAKVEDQEAVKNLDEIVLAADVIMVARGDLGIEVHVEELPIVQRLIAKRCMVLGRRFIVATHLLESMIEAPGPTRAEVTDVANAVFEQADALMLSGETSIGNYPVECVRMLDGIAKRIERSGGAGYADKARLDQVKQKTANSAIVLANSLRNCLLLVFTSRGVMANYASHLRPERAPIFAFTPDAKVCRSLMMNRAVHPFQLEFSGSPVKTIKDAIALLREKGFIVGGESIVILSDVLNGDPEVDAILLRQV